MEAKRREEAGQCDHLYRAHWKIGGTNGTHEVTQCVKCGMVTTMIPNRQTAAEKQP